MADGINWKKGDVLETSKGEQFMFGHYDKSGFWVHRITRAGKMDNGSLGLWLSRDGVKPATYNPAKRGGWTERANNARNARGVPGKAGPVRGGKGNAEVPRDGSRPAAAGRPGAAGRGDACHVGGRKRPLPRRPTEKELDRLPKGLQEFRASLWEMKYAPELLGRLCELSAEKFGEYLRLYREKAKIAAAAEEAARKARVDAAMCADNAFVEAVMGWTNRQLQKATGYDDE